MATQREASPGGARFTSLPSGVSFPSATYARAFLGLIRAGERLDRLLDDDLRAAHGIGLRGYEVLLHLAAFTPDGAAPMTTLIRQTPLSQSRVSRLVAELESRGLVRRSSDERDSRAVVVSLTDEGKQLLLRAQPTHHASLERHLFSRLTHDELARLGELTQRVLGDRDED